MGSGVKVVEGGIMVFGVGFLGGSTSDGRRFWELLVSFWSMIALIIGFVTVESSVA